MVTLTETNNRNLIDELFSRVELQQNNASKCLIAEDKGEIIGFCLFDLDEEKITIRYIDPLSDIPLADGILRSTLHIAAERFILDAFYAESISEEFFVKIDFIKNGAEKRLDIDKLFKSCCNCGR